MMQAVPESQRISERWSRKHTQRESRERQHKEGNWMGIFGMKTSDENTMISMDAPVPGRSTQWLSQNCRAIDVSAILRLHAGDGA